MDTSNLVTYAELFQLLAIYSGIWLALLSLIGSLAVAWYVRDSNRRDKDNERRHQELLRAIGRLYHHVHADGSPATVPLPDVDPAVPAPADN